MKKIGMYGGTFNPLHLGHVNDIMEATTMCDHLYIILSYSLKRDEIDHRIRYRWLYDLTKEMNYVTVLEVVDEDESKDSYNWEKGRDDIQKAIGQPIDIVFCGDDYKGKNLFERLYPNAQIHYFERKNIPISSTEIRANPYKNYEYLPKIVRPYYNKKVVIIGTESCGKSTLIRNLAKVFNTKYVEELGRNVCEEVGGIDNMVPTDFAEILLKHKVQEIDAIKEANKILFVDTESVVTMYYLKLLFASSFEKIDSVISLGEAIKELNNDYFYIFLEPDVKWVQDGTRTYGEDEVRQKNNDLLKAMLEEYSINYENVSGNYHTRYNKTKELVSSLIK